VHWYARPPPSPGNDAPLIGEGAATRGRSATEGADEHAGVIRRYPFTLQLAYP